MRRCLVFLLIIMFASPLEVMAQKKQVRNGGDVITVVVREVNLRGDNRRLNAGRLISNNIAPDAVVKMTLDNTLGKKLEASGAGGTDLIPMSDYLVDNIEEWEKSDNPDVTLLALCKDQARRLRLIIGPLVEVEQKVAKRVIEEETADHEEIGEIPPPPPPPPHHFPFWGPPLPPPGYFSPPPHHTKKRVKERFYYQDEYREERRFRRYDYPDRLPRGDHGKYRHQQEWQPRGMSHDHPDGGRHGGQGHHGPPPPHRW